MHLFYLGETWNECENREILVVFMIILKNSALMKMMEKCKKMIFFQKDLWHQTKLENASEKSHTCPRDPYALFYS